MKTAPVDNEAHLGNIVDGLNRLLANQFLLRSKMRNYRWNFREAPHHDLDRIIKDHGFQLERMIEEVVNVIQKRGGSVAGSLTQVLEAADLMEDAAACGITPEEAVVDLAKGHKKISRRLIHQGRAPECRSPTERQLGEQLSEWSQQHQEMYATLKAIARDRLRLH